MACPWIQGRRAKSRSPTAIGIAALCAMIAALRAMIAALRASDRLASGVAFAGAVAAGAAAHRGRALRLAGLVDDDRAAAERAAVQLGDG